MSRTVPTLQEQHEHLQTLVRMLLQDLPRKRDWLDPFLEECLREAVNAEPLPPVPSGPVCGMHLN